MSVAKLSRCTVRYRWCFPVIPWYRQAIALIFGLGVMLIALWGIDQGSGPFMIAMIAGMAMLSLLLIFGVEVDTVDIDTSGLSIDFTNTGVTKSKTVRKDESNDEE